MSDDLEGLRAELLRASRIEQPPSGLEERIARRLDEEPVPRSRRFFTPARAAVALSVLLGAAAYAIWASRPVEIATPEPLRPSVATPSAKSAAPVVDVPRGCLSRGRGSGRTPLIDDFEDGDGEVSAGDGRFGPWALVTDRNEKTGGPFTILPVKSGNGHALHWTGPEFREWGSSLEYPFPSHCYDASAYRGLAFRAKGPGRVYVAAREISVVPQHLDGTCTSDCFNSHVKLVVLGEKWQRFEVSWGELQQRGYGRPDVDASSLHSLQFLVRPEDSPFDVWIDDVAFIER